MIRVLRESPFFVVLLLLSLLVSVPATGLFAGLLDGHARGWAMPAAVLFFVLTLWIALSFWSATVGFVMRLFRRARTPTSAPAGIELPRTALLMPTHNEDPARVMAALQAMRESIVQTGQGARFEIFLLSDTTDPDIWLAEELAWSRHTEAAEGPCPIFYRHRRRNTGCKSGNLADFCRRWGRRYTYMVVLDADSLMSGEAILEMVLRMEADPRIGILQSPPVPVGRNSLFARLQQFAAAVYSPIYTSGYALWCGPNGNYWGHNAILRVSAFLACCGLPRLPGPPPLGGEILSHDFVEAALIRRAGWKVCLADDLADSYEECPTNLIDFAKRDQRWCQGNLQHLRLLGIRGWHPLSRLHFALGAMSYLAAPLWLMLMILAVVATAAPATAYTPPVRNSLLSDRALLLYAGAMTLLLLPRLWAYLLLLARPARLRRHGGALRAGVSVLVETAFSVLIAPILMLFQVRFVTAALLRRVVRWEPQRRDEQWLTFSQAWRAHGWQTLVGIFGAAGVHHLSPELFWWFLPVATGAVLAVPLSVVLSRSSWGRRLQRVGLLLVPAETDPPPILRRQQELVAASPAGEGFDPLLRVALDPVLNELHLAMLQVEDAAARPGTLAHRQRRPAPRCPRRICRIALYGGSKRLSRAEKMLLLNDPEAMRWLHEAAWRALPRSLLDRASRLFARRAA